MREFPGWVESGEPISWRHWVYGYEFLARARARESVRSASSATIANSVEEGGRREWWQSQLLMAGW